MRVLFLTNIPSPYRVDFFNELGKYCSLTVLYERNYAENRDGKWLHEKTNNFNSVFLKGKKIGPDSAVCFNVLKYLDRTKYDIVIVGGYSTPTGMIAISYMRFWRIPFILNADGGFINKNENIIKKYIKKSFITSATYWFSSGNKTTEYLKYYGAKQKCILKYPLTSVLEKDILKKPINAYEKMLLRQSLNITEEKIILAVGQFVYRKGFDVLIKSCGKIPKDYGVYIVGGAPTQEYLKLKNNLLLGDNVHFVGFQSKDELKEYYLASDIFVLPTREDVWGLVINEAMAYGLPVITTDKCIAGLELVQDCKNGFIVPTEDHVELVEKINVILSNTDVYRRMSQKSLEIIREYTIEKMAKRHVDIFRIIGDANG